MKIRVIFGLDKHKRYKVYARLFKLSQNIHFQIVYHIRLALKLIILFILLRVKITLRAQNVCPGAIKLLDTVSRRAVNSSCISLYKELAI